MGRTLKSGVPQRISSKNTKRLRVMRNRRVIGSALKITFSMQNIITG